jgi:hypothetical protein
MHRVHEFAIDAVHVAVAGSAPRSAAARPDFYASGLDALAYIALRELRVQANERGGASLGLIRARTVFAVRAACADHLSRERSRPADAVDTCVLVAETWRSVRAHIEGASPVSNGHPPLALEELLAEAERQARSLAEFGVESAGAVAAILRGTINELWRTSGEPFSPPLKLPPEMVEVRERKAQLEGIAALIAGMDGAGVRERSAAAMLLCAITFGQGAARAAPASFVAAFEDAWGRGRERDEDTRRGREAPVLRWMKSITNGLYALGHDGNTMTNTTRPRPSRAASPTPAPAPTEQPRRKRRARVVVATPPPATGSGNAGRRRG